MGLKQQLNVLEEKLDALEASLKTVIEMVAAHHDHMNVILASKDWYPGHKDG